MINADTPPTSTLTSLQPQPIAPASTDVLNGQTQTSSPPSGTLPVNTGNQIQSGSVTTPQPSSSPLQVKEKSSAIPDGKTPSDDEKVPPLSYYPPKRESSPLKDVAPQLPEKVPPPSYYPPNVENSPLKDAAPQLPEKTPEKVPPPSDHPSPHETSPPKNAERLQSDSPVQKEKLPPPEYYPQQQSESPKTQSPRRKNLFKSLYDKLLGKMDGRFAQQIRETIQRLAEQSRHIRQEFKNSKLRMKGTFPYYNPLRKKSSFEKLFDKILSKMDARTAQKIRGTVDRLKPRKKGFFEKLFNGILKRMDARTAQHTRDMFQRMGQEGRHLFNEIKNSKNRITAKKETATTT